MSMYSVARRTKFLQGLLLNTDHSLQLFCFQRQFSQTHDHVMHKVNTCIICPDRSVLLKTSFRNYSNKDNEQKTGKEIDVARENPYAGLSAGQKVKEASKDLSYLAIILGGLGVMGVMFYTVGKELLSKQSPGGIYNDALKICKKNYEVIDVLGEPIVGHGTAGSRRRRQIVNSHEFMVNGVKHMRIQFYINGPYRKATVHVEVYQDENQKYQYKYLIVELDGYPAKTIVIENNR